MKKLDKLILRSFFGPFILTFLVVVFILLTQFLLKYINDFVGKDLGIAIFGQLIGYFSVNMIPVALPLAILLSSLMTFGNLGEHFELTVIKSSGISLVRVLMPLFIVAVILTVAAFFINNNLVPRVNIKAWSLLYDVKQKKPALDFKEGTFYNGLPNFSIKVNQKFPDGETIKDIMIYDHRKNKGNSDVILADSGRMYTINEDRYLVMELFNGQHYAEVISERGVAEDEFMRNKFTQTKMVFNLSSFDLKRNKEELFASNKIMRNIPELKMDLDSIGNSKANVIKNIEGNMNAYFSYQFRPELKLPDSAAKTGLTANTAAWADSITTYSDEKKKEILTQALNQARSIRSFTKSYEERVSMLSREQDMYSVEIYKKYTQSLACLIMFLIGAPLGAIIKKGGLGVPVIISIIFFIIFYVLTMLGEKWSKEGVVEIMYGMWAANFILLWVGFYFLRKARNDSQLLDIGYYVIAVRNFFDKRNEKRNKLV